MSDAADRWRGFPLPEKYEILEVLGEGGFGIVYKVRNQDMDRVEALKVVPFEHAHLPAEKLRDDFRREARIMDALGQRSRYIVRVFELGLLRSETTDKEAGFFSMEFIAGTTLKKEVLSRGPFAIDRALELVSQICRALEIAHTHKFRDQVGILHRDLKLENALLVDAKGGEEVRILDFGLSKAAAETGSSRTVRLGAVATLGCAPPEQLSTKPLGPPADIYALGVLLFELITGHEPWFGHPLPRRISEPEAMDLLLADREPEPVSLARFLNGSDDPRVPQLETLVRQCLRLRPEDRIGSAAAFIEAVDTIRGQQPRGGRLGELYERATHAMNTGAWAEAVRHLEEIVEWDTGYEDASARLREATKQARLAELYDEARERRAAEEWTAVIEILDRIADDDADYADPDGLREDAARALEAAERERRLSELYGEAEAAARRGDWGDAIETLETIVEADPDYRDVANRLAEATRQARLSALYDEARDLRRDEEWEAVADLMARLRRTEPGYPDPDGLAGAAQEALARAERERRLADLYDRGVEAMDAEAWSEAIDALGELVAEEPDYRDAEVRLARAKRRQRLSDLYEEALRRRDAEDWEGVEEALSRLRATEPGHPDPQGLAAAAREALERARRERRLTELYERAVGRMDGEEWAEAVDALEAIVELDPQYRDAARRLAEATRGKRLAELYEKARRKGAEEEWEAVERILDRIHATEPSYPDPDGLQGAAHRALETAQRRRELQERYTRAVDALEAREWSEATRLFESVVEEDADYRDANARLAEATRQVRLADLYSEARRKRSEEDWEGVTAVFDRLRDADPDYPDPDDLLEAAREALRRAEAGPTAVVPSEAARGEDAETAAAETRTVEVPIEPTEVVPPAVGERTAQPRTEAARERHGRPAPRRSRDRALALPGTPALRGGVAAGVVAIAVIAWLVFGRSGGPPPSLALSIEGPATLVLGESAILTASGGASAGEDVTPMWWSSDEAVATVDEGGRILAAGVGQALVFAALGSDTARHAVSVTETGDVVERVALMDPPDSLIVDQRVTLGAMATLASGETRPAEGARWSSDDPGILRVDSLGEALAVAPGTSEVTVSVGDVSAVGRVRVVARGGEPGLQLSITGPRSVRVGETIRLEVATTGDPTADADAAVWRVSNAQIADFGSGATTGRSTTLRGLAEGQVNVSVELAGVREPRSVVVSGYRLTGVRPQLPPSLMAGERVALEATPEIAFGRLPPDLEPRWTTDNPSVATVDPSTNELVGVSGGSAIITAMLEGVSGSDTVNVVGDERSPLAAHAADLAGSWSLIENYRYEREDASLSCYSLRSAITLQVTDGALVGGGSVRETCDQDQRSVYEREVRVWRIQSATVNEASIRLVVRRGDVDSDDTCTYTTNALDWSAGDMSGNFSCSSGRSGSWSFDKN